MSRFGTVSPRDRRGTTPAILYPWASPAIVAPPPVLIKPIFPDDFRTGVNFSAVPTSLEDRHDIRTSISTAGIANTVRGVDLAIFLGILDALLPPVALAYRIAEVVFCVTPDNQALCAQIHQMQKTTGHAKPRPDRPQAAAEKSLCIAPTGNS